MDEVVDTFIEIELKNPEDFSKIRETLTRIGVASKKEKTLYQSCHILHKRGRYYITHFKELFLLDGKQATFDDNDVARRNTIAKLLEEWNLLTLVEEWNEDDDFAPLNQIKILPYREKSEWNLVKKYTIGSG
jgi:hypothetical protein